jgi:hypothetical protein
MFRYTLSVPNTVEMGGQAADGLVLVRLISSAFAEQGYPTRFEMSKEPGRAGRTCWTYETDRRLDDGLMLQVGELPEVKIRRLE